jgi:hypothetical protein
VVLNRVVAHFRYLRYTTSCVFKRDIDSSHFGSSPRYLLVMHLFINVSVALLEETVSV